MREWSDLEAGVREVLLADWDPSNAARSEAAREEYDAYVEPLREMILGDADEQAIIDYLYDREREIMCFPGLGKERLRRVARNLLTLRTRA
jgi:hypothetical protein